MSCAARWRRSRPASAAPTASAFFRILWPSAFPTASPAVSPAMAQLILLRESNLGFVADPAAGAGAFEALTHALCEKAWTTVSGDRSDRAACRRRSPAARSSVRSPPARRRSRATSRGSSRRSPASALTPISPSRRSRSPPARLERDAFTPADGALAPIRLAEPFEALARQVRRHSRARRVRGRRSISSRWGRSPRIAAASRSCANGSRPAVSRPFTTARARRPKRRSNA